MDTMRLKSIQDPRQTLYLLESFACDTLGVSPVAARVKNLSDLPAELRRHVGQSQGQHYVWFAWRDQDLLYLVTGSMSLDRARERGRPVLEVRAYDPTGQLSEFGTWVRTGMDRWERCEW